MLDLLPAFDAARPLNVLCIGAHCDDIEIGCGGTLLVLQRRDRPVRIDCAILTGDAARQHEARDCLSMLVSPQARGDVLFGEFQDGRLPGQYIEVKSFFESLKRSVQPDVILCHERDDRHQDHRIVNEMVWSTFRDALILEYEIPKWDGGLGQPNVYIPISRDLAEQKVSALLKAYGSQVGRYWFTRDTFMAMLRLRGVECRAESGLAEAFHGRKLRIARF